MNAQLIRFPIERRISPGSGVNMVLRILRQRLRLQDQKQKPKTYLKKVLEALR